MNDDPASSDPHDEFAPLAAWVAANAAPATTLVWGDDHCCTGDDFVHTGWVDVQIPEVEAALGWSWTWTIVGPDTEDVSASEIVCDYNVRIWRCWDESTYWWDDSVFVVTALDAELDADSRARFATEPVGLPGWTAQAISDALAHWCATELGRPDLSFVFDPNISSAMVAALADRFEAAGLGEMESYEIAPGIRITGPALDSLLERGIDEAAALTGEIVTQLTAIRDSMSADDEVKD